MNQPVIKSQSTDAHLSTKTLCGFREERAGFFIDQASPRGEAISLLAISKNSTASVQVLLSGYGISALGSHCRLEKLETNLGIHLSILSSRSTEKNDIDRIPLGVVDRSLASETNLFIDSVHAHLERHGQLISY